MKAIYLAIALVMISGASAWGDYKEKEDNCKEYDYYGKCKRCDYGYWVWNGECIDCIYGINWCEDCSQDGRHCFLCEKGFYLTKNGLCGICMNGINMCDICSPDGKECYKCIAAWELHYGKCYYNPYSGYGNYGYDDKKEEEPKEEEPKEEPKEEEEEKKWGWDDGSSSGWDSGSSWSSGGW